MKLTLVTPQKKLRTEVEVEEVIVPGEVGEMDILPGHAPLLSTLREGILRFREAGQGHFISAAISWGYVEIGHDEVIVLADTAEFKEEIDKPRAQEALKRSQEKLKMAGLPTEETLKFQRKEKRANVRIEVEKH